MELVVFLFLVMVLIRQKPSGSIDFLNGWRAALPGIGQGLFIGSSFSNKSNSSR